MAATVITPNEPILDRDFKDIRGEANAITEIQDFFQNRLGVAGYWIPATRYCVY